MKILAIGAHPDDIEFGCGASLMKFSRAGHSVYLFVATKGELGGLPEIRRKEQEDAVAFIGAKKVFWGGYADCNIAINQGIISHIEKILKEIKPDYIFVHNGEDTHQDHRILSNATISATRYIPNFLFYEGPTTINFSPNAYINIENLIEDKFALLRKHASQVNKVNVYMPDISIVDIAASTARYRGIQGRMKMAEAFSSLRLLIDIPEICK